MSTLTRQPEADTATQPAPIEVVNAMVAYEGRPVLRSVTFTAPRGKLIGIIGPNGAGKSTLLKAILGLIRLDSGSVSVFGQPLNKVRSRVAYVPQTEAVDWDFPVTAMDVVNHDLSVLDRFDLLMMLNQQIMAFGPTEDVATDDNLRLTYGGRLSLLDRADDSLKHAGPEMRDD